MMVKTHREIDTPLLRALERYQKWLGQHPELYAEKVAVCVLPAPYFYIKHKAELFLPFVFYYKIKVYVVSDSDFQVQVDDSCFICVNTLQYMEVNNQLDSIVMRENDFLIFDAREQVELDVVA